MDGYSPAQIAVIQTFVDAYRSMPEIWNRGEGFVNPNLSADEHKVAEGLVREGIFERRGTPGVGVADTFHYLSYRLSATFDFGQLVRDGQIVLR